MSVPAEIPQNVEGPVTTNGASGPPQSVLIGLSGSIGRLRWPILCFFQLGMIVGLYMAWTQSVSPVASQAITAGNKETIAPAPPTPKPPVAFPANRLDEADHLVREGRFESALVAFRSLLGPDDSLVPALLHYRIAVCLECLGKWDQAIADYSAVANSGADPRYEFAAQLGLSRVWMRKSQPNEAKNVVCDLLLRSGSSGFLGKSFLPETVFRLARLLAQECSGFDAPSPLAYLSIARASGEPSREYALDWFLVKSDTAYETASTNHETAGQSIEPNPIQIDNPRGTAEQMTVHGTLTRVSVAQALQNLTAACGRQCLLTPHAQQVISERTTSLIVDALPLATVLTAIAEPLGILWELTDNAIHFCSDQEVSKEALSAYRVRYAERALSDVLERYPDHELVAVAQFELANLQYSRGKLQEAVAIYQRLAAATPRSPVGIEASYNLGLALRRMDRNDAAREAFYRVVDGSPSHMLASLACLSIGRLYLDHAEFEKSIPPLRRAIAIASGTDVLPVAALLLASAYLLMDDPAAASSIIMQHRERLHEAPYDNATAFLASYARMLSSSGGGRPTQREARVLIWAITGANHEVLGPTGVLLMGHAYRELGLGNKMVELYQRALQQGVPPALHPEMSYEIAEQSLAAGEPTNAIEQFTNLATDGHGKWHRFAQLRLAELALEDGRLEACHQWCRKLLEPPDPMALPIVLKLMGRAYEQEGIHQKAALCFSGRLPEY